MKALVIYDATGRIWGIHYGETAVPQGITCMYVDIPDGAVLERIDVTDPEHPKAVFLELPDTDIGRLKAQTARLETQLTDAQLALAEQYETNLRLQEEITSTQLALTELYEGGEV